MQYTRKWECICACIIVTEVILAMCRPVMLRMIQGVYFVLAQYVECRNN